MDNITVDMNNLTEAERQQLLALIGKSKVYVPACGEKYWYIAPYGKIDNHGYWCNAIKPIGEDRLKKYYFGIEE